MADTWIPITEQLPEEGKIVKTKIANPDRNEQPLKRIGKLWFHPDGKMYVYYTPTHWAEMEVSELKEFIPKSLW